MISEMYHVIIKSVDNSCIYKDDEDKSTVLTELFKLTQISDAKILCYCVMGSNLNLILGGKHSNIANLISKLDTVYVSYYLDKYYKTGGTFKTIQKLIKIKDKHDFMLTMSYIHHIPVYAGIGSKS